jgi:hypothetical protein
MEYYDEIEHELYSYDSHEEDEHGYTLSPEDWQDMYSQELLNVWMSIVEYHEDWYLPLTKTFNQFCEFVYEEGCSSVQEIASIDLEKFFI